MQHVSLNGLGLTAGEAATTIQKLGPYLDTIALVVNDPSFPSLMDRIRKLNTLGGGLSGLSGLGANPTQAQVGANLRLAIKTLDAVIFARQNPWAVGLIGSGLVLFVASVGFAIGRRGRR